jgi:hypothetical protein
MPVETDGFDRSVPLPPELKTAHIREAIGHVENHTTELIDIYFEQANVFSGIVGIIGTQALHAVVRYKKHKHPDIAQQRFPDLSLRGRLNPPPEQALESKGSTPALGAAIPLQPRGMVHCLALCNRPNKEIEAGGKVVAIWRVDIVFLREDDWKYEGSRASEGHGGRTHTFGVKNPAKRLKGCIVYQHPRIAIRHGGPVLTNGED